MIVFRESFFCIPENLSWDFYGGNVVRVLFHLFLTAAYFHLALVAASISHFVTAATKFSCSSNQKMSPLFFISHSRSLSPFFSLSFAGLPATFSSSLSFSCSIYIPNLWTWQLIQAKYFRQHGYRNNFRFPFSSLLTHKFSLLYKTPVAMPFPAKMTLSSIWVAIPVDWVILHWCACGADGRSLGRAVGQSVYGHVITKFSRLITTFSYPLVLRGARFSRESSAMIAWTFELIQKCLCLSHPK